MTPKHLASNPYVRSTFLSLVYIVSLLGFKAYRGQQFSVLPALVTGVIFWFLFLVLQKRTA